MSHRRLFPCRTFRILSARYAIQAACLVFVLALLAPAQGQPAAPQASAGSTVETAIVLPNIADEFHGVAAEHTYIAGHFSTWHIEYQSLIEQNGRHYDLLGMIEPDGAKTALYFDITDWFGK
jgi:hypothetical protein